MRKILSAGTLCSAIILTSTAFAAAPIMMDSFHSGFYLGIQAGYAKSHYSKSWMTKHAKPTITSVSSLDNDGFAARGYFGYDFTKNWAAELGYAYLPTVKFKKVAFNSATGNMDFDQYAIDLLVKGTIPFANGFALFGKVGPAWLHRDDPTKTIGGSRIKRNLTNGKVIPVAGVGLAYHFNSQVSTDISYLRYFNNEATDLVTLGLAYKF